MKKENLVIYSLPVATAVFLILFFFVFESSNITGFAVYQPEIAGYIKISVFGNLPNNCSIITKFYYNNTLIEEKNLSSEEFVSKSRIEKNALEEIYFLDINKLLDKNINADDIIAEVWCGKLAAKAETKL